MSMFNDIDRKKNDENSVSNAEKVKNYAMRFSQGHWTFLGPGSEEKRYGNSSHAQKRPAGKMVQRFKETGHLLFKSISALSRGILKQRKGKNTMHFNGGSMNTELLFQTIHSVNQLSVYAAVSNRCEQFGLTEEEKGRASIPVDNKILTMGGTRRSDIIGISSDSGTWNRMQEGAMSFQTLERKVQLPQLCEKAYFQYLVAAGKQHKIRPEGDDGWRTITLLCREYLNSRSYPNTPVLAAIPEGTIIGPVLEGS